MTQEQSVLTKLDKYFKTEDKLFQHSVLGYRIDLYLPKYKLAIEVDELGHCTRDIKSEIERKNRIEKELGCKFIRIDPSRKNFGIIDEFSKIKDYITKCTNKTIKIKTRKGTIDKDSDKLFSLEFKSNNPIKTKCLKWIV